MKNPENSTPERQVEIDKHVKAAERYEKIAKHHREAARCYGNGDDDQARENAHFARTIVVEPFDSPNTDPTQHAAM